MANGKNDSSNTGSKNPTVGTSSSSTTDNRADSTNDTKKSSVKSENTGATGRKADLQKQGVPSNDVAVPPQVVSRDELSKDEYTYEDGRLEIDRGHPNYIFDNQRNQQAQENTVEVAAGTRNPDGTLNERHPLADTANPAVVQESDGGETKEEQKNREELKK